jgi:multicomponent Na+:H+ antiporter subunit A
MSIWLLIFAPLITSGVLALLPSNKQLLQFSTLIPLILFAGLIAQSGAISDGETFHTTYQWVDALGLELSFVLDGLSYLFALIITGIGTLIVFYTNSYFHEKEETRRFLIYLFIFMSAMLGIVMSGNFLGMFIFWEMTTISSYLLIGFKHDYSEARIGARKAFIVTGGGGLALLGGIAMIGVMSGGVYDFATLDTMANDLANHTLFEAALILIIIGAFTKSAQFPFHFWLPGAMEAPTPASSFLHSATMVKAGVYLLARLAHTFGDSDIWLYALGGVGLFTFVYGAFMALSAYDLKGILAYTTLSWLGVLIALIGINTKDSIKAAMVGIIAHALYKGALFLAVGSIDHEAGSRDVRKLGRLASAMPMTAAASALVLLSMAGIPPMIGFVAKETLKVAALEHVPEAFAAIFPVGAVAGSALTVAAATVIGLEVFIRKPQQKDEEMHAHEAPLPMWSGPLFLGLLSLIFALFLHQFIDPIINPAVATVYGQSAEVELHLIPALDDTAFQLSLLSIGIGVVIGAINRPLRDRLANTPLLDPTGAYNKIFGIGDDEEDTRSLLAEVFRFVNHRLQNGILRHYLNYVFVTFVFIMLAAIIQGWGEIKLPELDFSDVTLLETFIASIIIISAVATAFARRRLGAVVWAGVAGVNTALLFALFGAPDLAFTQLLIEVLALIFLMLAFRLLPRFMQDTSRFTTLRTVRDIIISVMVGLVFGLLALLATANREATSIRYWFEENAHELGKGNNIVNVILVDFRGLDTLGETTVLVIAALSVLALISPMPLLDMLDKHFKERVRRQLEEEAALEEDGSVISNIYRNINRVLLASVNYRGDEDA